MHLVDKLIITDVVKESIKLDFESLVFLCYLFCYFLRLGNLVFDVGIDVSYAGYEAPVETWSC